MHHSSFLGRAAEVARIAALIDGARGGCGGSLRFVGEAGIGKSALLDHVAATLGDDVTVLRVTGYEEEVDLPWSGLESLVAGLLAEGLDENVAPPRRAALRAVLALEGRANDVDPFAVAAAVGDLVLVAAKRRPVVVLVDDVHWLDEPTGRTLRHSARRWTDHAVAMIEAGRPDGTRSTPPAAVTLCAMDRTAAIALVEQHGVVSAKVRERLVDEMGGRPLLLKAAVTQLGEDEKRGGGFPTGPVRFPPSVFDVAMGRVEDLDAVARWALLVTATVPAGDVDLIGRVLAQDGGSVDDLADAERRHLVTVGDRVVEFDHPTVRSAVYHGAEGAHRRRAHRLVGGAMVDPAASVQHLGLGVAGPDAQLAERVAGASDRLIELGAPVEAARALQLAARLSPDQSAAAVCLRKAAELLVDTVEAPAIGPLLDRADLATTSVVEQIRRAALRIRVGARSDDVADAADELVALATQVQQEDPGLAARLLLEALVPQVRSGRAADVLRTARRAQAVAGAADDELLTLRAEVALGGALVAARDPAGGPMLDRFRELLAREGTIQCGAFLAEVVAPILGFLHRSADAKELLDHLESDLRDRDAIPLLISVLGARAMLAHGPNLGLAVAASAEAVALAEAIGQPDLARLAGSSLAVAAGMMGDEATTRTAAARLEARDDAFSHRGALIGLGALALGQGDLGAALSAYERLRDEHGVGTGPVRWEPEWAETLVRLNRREDAAATLEQLDSAGYADWALAGVARVRGMLAVDHDEAAEQFQLSIAILQLARNPVGEGRTQLVWGERLRRARRRGAAREHLERSHELLTGCGAAVWVVRVEEEMRRATGTVRGRNGSPTDLTDHELKVARLAVKGASNAEIGHGLFISPRTVEAHLTAVYRKLALRNRRELAALAVTDQRLRNP